MSGVLCGPENSCEGRHLGAGRLIFEARLSKIHPLGQRPEFIADQLKAWLKLLEVKPLYIEPGSPWENGYCESFNGKMRYELLDGEIFFSLLEATVIIERWRNHYNTRRPHSSLGGRPPAPVTIQLAS